MRRIINDDQTEHAVDLIFRELCRVVLVHWQEQEGNVLISIEVEVFGIVRVNAWRANILRIVLSFEEIVRDVQKRRNCCQDRDAASNGRPSSVATVVETHCVAAKLVVRSERLQDSLHAICHRSKCLIFYIIAE